MESRYRDNQTRKENGKEEKKKKSSSDRTVLGTRKGNAALLLVFKVRQMILQTGSGGQ